MTEAEWLTPSSNARHYAIVPDMIDFLWANVGERKLRLFAHACCRRIEQLLVDERSRTALAGLERYADGGCTPAELDFFRAQAREAVTTIETPLSRDGVFSSTEQSQAARAVENAVAEIVLFAGTVYAMSSAGEAASSAMVAIGLFASARSNNPAHGDAAKDSEARAQAALLRDIFGNPFRPVTFSPEWRTDTAVTLARQVYESRDFGAMPILADALQDAGCDNEDILSHCRGPGRHVRGCWVVDLVLGKE